MSVTLQSIRKDVMFEPTDMIVANWPVRIGEVFVKEGDPVPPGAPILSLTDPNFTVTLQASASDRTKLKVGQHCTVELVGGVNEVPGTISELDQNLTTLSSSTPGQTPQEVYEGKIEVGDLGAADGAAVTITVVDQQDTNVHHRADRGGEAERVGPGRRAGDRSRERRQDRTRCPSPPDSPRARTSRSRRA